MSECDGCGRPIGHATEIQGEYHSEELDRNHYYFGSRECKEEFERHHEVVEKTECPECGDLVKKKQAVREKYHYEDIGMSKEELTHESCASELKENN